MLVSQFLMMIHIATLHLVDHRAVHLGDHRAPCTLVAWQIFVLHNLSVLHHDLLAGLALDALEDRPAGRRRG